MVTMRLHERDSFFKSDGAAGSISVVRAGVDGYCSSECTWLSSSGGGVSGRYHGEVVCVPKC